MKVKYFHLEIRIYTCVSKLEFGTTVCGGRRTADDGYFIKYHKNNLIIKSRHDNFRVEVDSSVFVT